MILFVQISVSFLQRLDPSMNHPCENVFQMTYRHCLRLSSNQPLVKQPRGDDKDNLPPPTPTTGEGVDVTPAPHISDVGVSGPLITWVPGPETPPHLQLVGGTISLRISKNGFGCESGEAGG